MTLKPPPSDDSMRSDRPVILGELLDNLGAPPPDLTQRFVDLARESLEKWQQKNLDGPLPSTDPQHWQLMPSGEIRWVGDPHFLDDSLRQREPDAARETDAAREPDAIKAWLADFQKRIDSVARSTVPTSEAESSDDSEPSVVSVLLSTQERDDSLSSESESTGFKSAHQKRGMGKPLGLLAGVVVLACLGVAVWWGISTGSKAVVADRNPDSNQDVGVAAAPKASANESSRTNIFDPSPTNIESLELIDLSDNLVPPEPSDLASDLLASETAMPELDLSVLTKELSGAEESTAQGDPEVSSDLTNPLLSGGFSGAATNSDSSLPMDSAAAEGDGSPNDGPSNPPPASLADVLVDKADSDEADEGPTDDQETKTVTANDGEGYPNAVSLSPASLADDSGVLWDSEVSSTITLESLDDQSSLSVRGQSPVFEVIDPDGGLLASLRSDEGSFQFAWADGQENSNNAKSLQQSRLKVAGQSIYLRPAIVADPFRFRFDSIDQKPAWNLGLPIVLSESEMTFDWQLPEKVDVSWIEPVESDSFRGGRAIAVLTPGDDETFALGMRMDFKCGRKLSCRIRFAARLDPAMPWQPISTDLLRQAGSELAATADAISREKERLAQVDKVAYSIAGRRGKEIIAEKTRRNDARGDWVRTSLKRVGQLDALMSQLEAESSWNLSLLTRWKDEMQVILQVGETP